MMTDLMAAASRTRSSACRREQADADGDRDRMHSSPRRLNRRSGDVVLALGPSRTARSRARGLKASAYVLGDGAGHLSPVGDGCRSYHCSRDNTQTKRLTTGMFREVVGRATARARGRIVT